MEFCDLDYGREKDLLEHFDIFSFIRSETLSGEFSVFTSHVMKTNNRNHSMNKLKNLGYDR